MNGVTQADRQMSRSRASLITCRNGRVAGESSAGGDAA